MFFVCSLVSCFLNSCPRFYQTLWCMNKIQKYVCEYLQAHSVTAYIKRKDPKSKSHKTMPYMIIQTVHTFVGLPIILASVSQWPKAVGTSTFTHLQKSTSTCYCKAQGTYAECAVQKRYYYMMYSISEFMGIYNSELGAQQPVQHRKTYVQLHIYKACIILVADM